MGRLRRFDLILEARGDVVRLTSQGVAPGVARHTEGQNRGSGDGC